MYYIQEEMKHTLAEMTITQYVCQLRYATRDEMMRIRRHRPDGVKETTPSVITEKR